MQNASPARQLLLVALDGLIAIYTLLLLLRVFSEIDLGPLTPDRAEKPILILILVVPVRIALGGQSWLLDRALAWVRPLARFRTRSLVAIPRAVVDATFAVVVTRAATLPIGFLANLLFPASRTRAFSMPFQHERFAEIFAAWDSGWYFDIARHGYYWQANGQSSVAFFPLYPMLMRAVALPFGGSDRAVWLAGILVSCGAFLAALVVLHRLTERIFGDGQVARRTVLYVAVFPFAIFFTRVYSESIFLLTTVLAVSRAYDRRWLQAGLWGALAALARPNGILIALPLLVMAVQDRPGVRVLAGRLAALLPIPLALAGYCGFVYSLSGDPLAWLHAESQWGYSLGHPPWRLLLTMISRMVKHGWYDVFFAWKMAPFRLFHGTTALIFLVLTPAVFKRLGTAMGVYVLISLLVPLSSNELEGIGRYASVLFPVFMLAGTVTSQRLHEAILIVSALFHTLFICLFVTLRPIY